MAIQLRSAFGAAWLIAPLLGLSPAAAQEKRLWVDPPADLATQAGPNAATTSAAPHPAGRSVEPAEKPAAAPKSALGAETRPTTKPVLAPPKTRTAASRSVGRAVSTAKAPLRQARSTRPESSPTTHVTARGGATRPAQDRRLSLAGRPLELMSLQTIELPDGRRLNVLTRPDPQMVEDVLQRR
jgi:hypothetical protein